MPFPVVPIFVVGVGVGVYLQGGSLTKSAFWTATTLAISQMVLHPVRSTVAISRGASYVWTTPLKGMTADAVGSQAAQVTAGAALGYAIGATVGTTITAVAEEKGLVYEGATADVLDFYLPGRDAHYWDPAPMPGNPEGEPMPGYFNIPGDARYIYRHYRNKWFGA